MHFLQMTQRVFKLTIRKKLTIKPCHGSFPLKRNISVYAKDSRSSLLLPVLPKCACTLA